ncbi:hypothetical protein BDQ94DRAFT_155062 [Aspergillus welwitschiae]|uniref:Uncharacterized protein n=1 Tax=Aspergillus welwitschiae TaxID=1341132 RepID=A0A3F3PIF1_9EURO|nr:hypothetical protein BDQ94DRAFT_155062 [Aspergillus welwitschiae]RDH26711.1 hypothetical protein BDQ94DRAFT_155062 [Aspergillus welwitschiae]
MTFLLHYLNPYLHGLTPKANTMSNFEVVDSLCVTATVVINPFTTKHLGTACTIL